MDDAVRVRRRAPLVQADPPVEGEDDQYGSTDQVTRVVAQVSGPAEGLLLPKCGHSPHAEHARAVLDASLSFLAHHRVTAASDRCGE